MKKELTDLIKKINKAVFITALIVLLFDRILANKFSAQITDNTKLMSNILLTDETNHSTDNLAANTEIKAKLDDFIDTLYNRLSISQKAAQMIMVGTSEKKGIGLPYTYVKYLVKNNITGGVLFLKGNSEHFRQQRIELDTIANKFKINPIYACDCEPTLFHKKFTDLDSVLPTSELTDTAKIGSVLNIINSKMNYIGLQINFAPVADISANQQIIKTRSFGQNPVLIEYLSDYFVNESRNYSISCAIKHFPGHGAVVGDTHKETVYIDGELTELTTFSNIIHNSNPDFVMVGHMSIKNNKQYNTFDKPCTISKNIVTGLLKDKLNYKGIVITDAMNMKAVKKFTNSDWLAILAGNDIILMPNDVEQLHRNICAALQKNDNLTKQLELSIKKILRLKLQNKIITNY